MKTKLTQKIKEELANIFGYVEELSPREMERLGIEDIKRMKISNLEYRMVCRLLEKAISQNEEQVRKEAFKSGFEHGLKENNGTN